MKFIASFLIKFYRSTAFIFPVQCKFYPSCSHYVEEVFRRYPFFQAIKLSLKRLIRCNWFSRGGVDPVP